jgi:excisionase family DNA binding protein
MREAGTDYEILTLREAARFVRVSEKTLGDMARRKRIPGQKVGREWRFLRQALEKWLSGLSGLGAGSRQGLSGTGSQAGRVKEPEVQYQFNFPGFRDTAFTENHNRALHRWVPWIAGFSASFVDGVLEKVASSKTGPLRVLDPFAGVGTTLIEALKNGHDAVGFEINPYAALACKAKVKAGVYDIPTLKRRISAFQRHMANGARPKSRGPEGFASRVPFFSPRVERQVLKCLDFVRGEGEEWVRDLLRIAFGSVLVGFSNYSFEPSLGTREAAGKPNIEDADVGEAVARRLGEMVEDIAYFQRTTASLPRTPEARVFRGSFFDLAGQMDPQSMDVLITSPPYLNNYHYIRNTRPHMFWLEMVTSPSDLKEMEQKSFGQFWQTVRSGAAVALMPKIEALSDLIEKLRERNTEKGPYGGPGWANYAASYFNDCERFCRTAFRLMKPGGTAVVVIGNNILQGIEFPTDRFYVIEMHEVRKKRTGSSILNSSVRAGTVAQPTRLYETAVELRAPGLTSSRLQ